MNRAFAVLNSEYKYCHWKKWDVTPSSLEEGREMHETFQDYLLVLYEPEQHSSPYMSRRIAFSKSSVSKDCHKLFKFSVFQAFSCFQDFNFEILWKFLGFKFLSLCHITVRLAFHDLFYIQIGNKIFHCLLFYITSLALFLLPRNQLFWRSSDNAKYIYSGSA